MNGKKPDASAPAPAEWAVINTEGLQLIVGLTREGAAEIAADPAYPPGGENPGECYAVPRRVADVTQQLWTEYQVSYERKLREARRARMKELFGAYEETKELS